jgi:subtilisin-like proprotein convertase family protein
VKYEFQNTTAVPIDPGPPNVVSSSIDVTGAEGVVQAVDVAVDVEHSWDGDLTIELLNPSGRRVVLVDRRGGHRNDFQDTGFDADAPNAIADAAPPFRGTFRPEGNLGDFRNRPADGTWTLEVRDHAFQDGGVLRRWSLGLATIAAPTPSFQIDVRVVGGLTDPQRDAFDVAAQRWSEMIVGDLPAVTVYGETVDDVVITAEGVAIDGPGGVLGQAGPTVLRPGTALPAWGVMEFDTADLARIEADGSLVRVIMHEMGHVLGFGTIWQRLGLRQGAGTINPTFTGPKAMAEFALLLDAGGTVTVPLANTGGPGTRDSHWRESVFGNELMTGFLDVGENPISRLSIAAFADTGYQVDYNAADAYALPSFRDMAMMGVGIEGEHGGYGTMLIPPQTVLPEDALVER